MVQVVYGDILLLIDFCMNFFVLYTTAIILRRKTKLFCIGGAAFVGGIYSVAKIFVSGNDILDCIISLCVGLLMCYISFGGYRFLKTAVVFFCTSALLGGIMFAVYFMLASYHRDIFGNMQSYAYSHIPIWLFLVLAAISFAVAWAFSYIGRERADQSEETVTVEYMGKRVSVRLILDSGNFAREPISGKYVVLLSREMAANLFCEELYKAVMARDSEFLLKRKFRLVGVSDIGGERHTYYAFMPDKMYLNSKGNMPDIDAYIAVCDSKLLFRDCDGLAHPSVIAG